MELSELESLLGVELPPRHRQALSDPADPVRNAGDFLLADSPYELLRLADVNAYLRSRTTDPWPPYLVAIAPNGCGDYFAYDSRRQPMRVVYIDPAYTVQDNLAADDQFDFVSFDEWREWRLDGRPS